MEFADILHSQKIIVALSETGRLMKEIEKIEVERILNLILTTFKEINQISNSNRTMNQRIAHIALVVKDYDEAIEFYTQKLDFTLIEDTIIDVNKRWVMVAPTGAKECCILLAKASDDRQAESIGNQTGGRVGFFLFTDDFWRDFNKMTDRNINFVRPPTKFKYGTVAVFEDLYGNLWDLIEPNELNKGLI